MWLLGFKEQGAVEDLVGINLAETEKGTKPNIWETLGEAAGQLDAPTIKQQIEESQ